MNILGISMIKNESDIVEAFVRHNLAYLDALVIIDNDSTDGTREILDSLQREGLPIIVFDDPIFGYFQSEKMTYVFRKTASIFAPDYVFLLDADEFIVAPPRSQLESRLSAIIPETVGQIPWKTYIPNPKSGQQQPEDPLARIHCRRIREQPEYFKAVLAPACIPAMSIVIAQGNHEILMESGHPFPHITVPDAALGHFPIRSLEQLTAKTVTGWMAYLDRNRIKKVQGQGYQWQRLYEQIVHGNGINDEDVTQEALRYAQPDAGWQWPGDVVSDPMKPNYELLKYNGMGQTRALSRIVSSFERLFAPNPRLHFAFPQPEQNSGGAAESLRANTYLDLPPLRRLAHKLQPKKVLELGCGAGGYMKLFDDTGVENIIGVDKFSASTLSGIPGSYMQHDLGQPLDLGSKFDLVLCLEVIAHLDPPRTGVLLDTIIKHAERWIVFSAADIGQPGTENLSCRPIAFWLRQFGRRGWSPQLFDTLAARSLATLPWLRRNLIILAPGGTDSASVEALVSRAKQPAIWGALAPSVIRHPLWELVEAGKKKS